MPSPPVAIFALLMPTRSMSARKFLLAGLAAALLPACNTDLDVTAPYQENTIVYGLLDKDSTTQYLRINKAFLGPGNALVYAQVPDSSEYQEGQLQAEVQEVKNGVVMNTYTLQDTLLPHDPGIFAGPLHKLYYFNATLDSSATYRLVATAKGNAVSAEASPVGWIAAHPTILNPPLRLTQSIGDYTAKVIRWQSAVNGKRYDISYRFRWDDVVGGDTIPRSFTQFIGTVLSTGTGGGESMNVTMEGEAFFQTVGLRAGDNPNATRRIFRGVDILWAVAGQDLYNYLRLSSPISGLVEERPTYTNITNGLGLLSSRRFMVVVKPTLDLYTIPELVQGQYTASLNFCIPGSDFDCN